MRAFRTSALALLVLALVGAPGAHAIDVCGNGICLGTAVPPETCSTCPADCGVCPPPPAVLVVNMMPFAQSGETTQDSQPHLAVNPLNPQQIAGATANTASNDPLFSPLFVSTNGGTTWILNNILHGGGPAGNTTLSFGAGNNLYAAGQLFNSGYTIVARTSNIASPSAMSILFGRPNVLQPWVQARPNAGGDRLYFGFDDLAAWGTGKTASIARTPNATVQTPLWETFKLGTRPACFEDLPPVRLAIHADGTVYGVYYRRQLDGRCNESLPIPSDVVVVRDDNG